MTRRGESPTKLTKHVESRFADFIPAGVLVIADLVGMVSELRQVAPKDIVGKTRARDVAYARQEVMWLLREVTDKSFPQIGRNLNRDHSTVLHGVRAVEERRTNSPTYTEDTDWMLGEAMSIAKRMPVFTTCRKPKPPEPMFAHRAA